MLKKVMHISRPYLWIYSWGPFLFGVQGAVLLEYPLELGLVFLFLLMLTLPVNLFVFALNDYFDTGTDAHNPKKDTLEHRAEHDDRSLVWYTLVSLGVILGFALWQEQLVQALILLWVLLVVTYNVPPLKLKARPILDMFFAVNFPLWGVVGYTLVAGAVPPLMVLLPMIPLACMFHLYSAVNDMPHDKEASVITTAVWIGSVTQNLYTSLILTCISVALLLGLGWYMLAAVVSLYVVFLAAHWFDVVRADLLRTYRYFIVLQYVAGISATIVQAIMLLS